MSFQQLSVVFFVQELILFIYKVVIYIMYISTYSSAYICTLFSGFVFTCGTWHNYHPHPRIYPFCNGFICVPRIICHGFICVPRIIHVSSTGNNYFVVPVLLYGSLVYNAILYILTQYAMLVLLRMISKLVFVNLT